MKTVPRVLRPCRAVIYGAAALAIAVALVIVSPPHQLVRATPDVFEPFSPASPFRTPIPANAAVDPNSAAMVASVSRDDAMYANLVKFGIPIYHSSGDEPRYHVACINTSWGPCPFDDFSVPIPDGARPHTGSDGAMVVVDHSTRRVFEFWQARHAGGLWTATFGAVNDLDGSGWGGNSTASGASRLAGVIQIAEIARGEIPHALALQSDYACADIFRPPALKTDGRSTRSDCVPEGARLRLDPSVDVDRLELAPAERAVARALQTYGAYLVDRGGSPLSVSFELDPAAAGDSIGQVYHDAGLRWDYDQLPGIPWSRLQVLA